MTFFPGEKFSRETDGTPERYARVAVTDGEDGVTTRVTLRSPDGAVSEAEDSEPWRRDGADRTRKVSAGRAFFNAAVRLTGYRPPWGIMTGVRPSKLAMEFLSSGMTPEESAAELSSSYLAGPEKARLAVSVALAERGLVSPGDCGECSVYAAIPFCPTRCDYCSFVSYASPRLLSLIPEYLRRLADDISYTEELIRELGLRVSTVYIGGGTPTVLDPSQLDFLLTALDPLSRGAREFTLEAGRPDTITDEKLAVAASHGVGRISVNTQTLNEAVLAGIGRRHTAEQFFRAFEAGRRAGIGTINVDLIAGLPGDDPESFGRTCRAVTDLRPENLTVHTFTVKKSAKLREEGVYDREGRDAETSVAIAARTAADAGYAPYYMYRQKNTVGNLENVGYSVPGRECLYNVFMMEEIHSIFACGASAVTKLVSPGEAGGSKVIKRIFEPKYPYEYLREREEGAAAAERKTRRAEITAFCREHGLGTHV